MNRCSACLIGVAALLAMSAAEPAYAQIHVEDVRLGFGPPANGVEGNYKIGSWAPARIKLRTEKTSFSGRLELSTWDSDDVEAIFRREVSLAPHETLDFVTYVKPGKQMPDYYVRLVDGAGNVQAQEVFEASGGVWDGAPPDVTLIVAVGNPAGLDAEMISKRPGYPREQFRIGRLESTRELPARWFGYDAVDHLILCLDDPQQIENMDVAGRMALETWVRNGGHLVISVGTGWERVQAVLGPMFPAEIDGTETVTQLKELESYLGASAAPIRVRDPLSVPHMTNLRGQLVAGARDLPLAVQAPLGFGLVTLVGLELNREPFLSWEGRTDFWIKLLNLKKQFGQNDQQRGAWGSRAVSDLSSQLRLQLEHFEGVSLVPFQWVAFFIFLYILLIGPVDYWLVKKVLKRMELTWVTFPTMVVVVSLAAYLTAHWLKGDELRINKIDVVDVDQASGSLRGTSWFTLFSPQIKTYGVRIEPQLAAQPSPPSQAGGPPIVMSWLGLAEDAIGGMSRQGGGGLFRRSYAFGPDAQTLIDVPVQVWSMKGFAARWHAQAGLAVDADLTSADMNRVLKGSITNRLKIGLADCSLIFGRKIYPLGPIPPDGSVVVGSRSSEDLSGHMSRRAGSISNNRMQSNDLVYVMMFHKRLPDGGDFPQNNYFDDLDLSDLLDHQRAILVGKVEGAGSRLILNDAAVTEFLNETCYLRVILPVTPGPAEPILLNPPTSF